MVIPLATFATDFKVKRKNYCKLYVQKLFVDSYSVPFDYSIILGSMFFQQISMFVYATNPQYYEVPGFIMLGVNENALSSTYIGSEQRGLGPDPFQVNATNATFAVQQMYSTSQEPA